MDEIVYSDRDAITVDELISVFEASTLGERRPVDDREAMEAMVRHADLTVTARAGGRLVGVARSVTDFAYCCYLSDLAVDRAYQRRGIGVELIRRIRARLGPKAELILLSAPAAEGYYPRIGFTRHPQAYTLDRDAPLGGDRR